MTNPPASVLRFGIFELDLGCGELRRQGLLVPLRPQPLKLLALLVSRPGRVVPRHDIQERLWGTATFVDFDQGVNHCVRQIRTALGDEAGRPRFVQTLPRRGYRFLGPVEALPSPAGPASADALEAIAVERLVVAVLPFDDLSRDANGGCLGDGLTDEIITQLGRLQPERLAVVSRTSVRRYRQTCKTAFEVGRELGAPYIVEGSVRQAGGRVRACAQLVEARLQTQLWAETYERPGGDLLAAQSEVGEAIARDVRVALSLGCLTVLAGTL